MATGDTNRKLILALASALAAALLAIAFLVGRESGRASPGSQQAVVEDLPRVPILAPKPPNEDVEAHDPWQRLDEEYGRVEPDRRPFQGIARKPDGTILLSNTRRETKAEDEAAGTRSAEPRAAAKEPQDERAAYFEAIDRLRSNTGAGDPNTFAVGLIKAGMGGATSGFDQLISDTERITEELKAMTPPPCCGDYHQANIVALQESRELLQGMKLAISRHDIQALSEIAQQAANLQNKAEALKDLRKEIRASAN